jgi:tight adherence protein B
VTGAPLLLLAAGGFSALMLAAAGLLVLDQRNRLVAQRTAVVAKPYAPVSPTMNVRLARLTGQTRKRPLTDRIGRMVGLEIDRPDLYPLPWWVVFLASLVTGFVVARITIYLVGPIGWAAWPTAWLLGARWLFLHWQRKYQTTLLRQLPDALAMIVRSVRAGIPVSDAFGVVAREAPPLTAREFTLMHGELSVGLMLDEALWKLAARTGLREYRFLAVALSLQAQTGGNLTETLDNLAEVIRKRAALRQRGRALTSEARATAMVLAALPVAVGGILFIISPGYIVLLFVDPLGKKILLGVFASLFMGLATIRSLIRRTLA